MPSAKIKNLVLFLKMHNLIFPHLYLVSNTCFLTRRFENRHNALRISTGIWMTLNLSTDCGYITTWYSYQQGKKTIKNCLGRREKRQTHLKAESSRKKNQLFRVIISIWRKSVMIYLLIFNISTIISFGSQHLTLRNF